MSTDADIEGLVDALRQDGPSDRDAERVRARLAALGVVAGVAVTSTAVASSLPAGKLAATATTRWATLALLPKVGVVTALGATAIAGTLAVVHADREAVATRTSRAGLAVPARHEPVANDSSRTDPVPAQAAPAARADTSPVATAERALAPLGGDDAPANVAQAARGTPPSGAVTTRAASPAVAAPRAAQAAIATQATATDTSAAARTESTASFSGENATNAAVLPPPSVSTLAAETALIDAAFAALRAGDFGTASALVAEHERRFPSGALSREREHARELLSGAAPRR